MPMEKKVNVNLARMAPRLIALPDTIYSKLGKLPRVVTLKRAMQYILGAGGKLNFEHCSQMREIAALKRRRELTLGRQLYMSSEYPEKKWRRFMKDIETRIPELGEYDNAWPFVLLWDVKHRDDRANGVYGRKYIQKGISKTPGLRAVSLVNAGNRAIRYVGKRPPLIRKIVQISQRIHSPEPDDVPMDAESTVTHAMPTPPATFQRFPSPARLAPVTRAPILPPESAMKNVSSASPQNSLRPVLGRGSHSQSSETQHDIAAHRTPPPKQYETCLACGSAPNTTKNERLRTFLRDEGLDETSLHELQKYGISHDLHLELLERLDEKDQNAVVDSIRAYYSKRLASHLNFHLQEQKCKIQFSPRSFESPDVDERLRSRLRKYLTERFYCHRGCLSVTLKDIEKIRPAVIAHFLSLRLEDLIPAISIFGLFSHQDLLTCSEYSSNHIDRLLQGTNMKLSQLHVVLFKIALKNAARDDM